MTAVRRSFFAASLAFLSVGAAAASLAVVPTAASVPFAPPVVVPASLSAPSLPPSLVLSAPAALSASPILAAAPPAAPALAAPSAAALPRLAAAARELGRGGVRPGPLEGLFSGARRAFGAAAAAPAAVDARDPVFTNSWTTPREIRRRLGYDPLARPRAKLKLDGPAKGNVDIFQLTNPSLVVKIADDETVTREVALRVVHEMFSELFSPFFDMPPVAAASEGLIFPRHYLVMPKVDGATDAVRAFSLPLAQRPALAAFAITFGFRDMNEGAILFHYYRGRSAPFTLLDAERAGERMAPPPDDGRARLLEPMPWLGHDRPNSMDDYRPFLERWLARLARPGVWDEMRARLLAAGLERGRVELMLNNFRANAETLEETLEGQMRHANRAQERRAAVLGPMPSGPGPEDPF